MKKRILTALCLLCAVSLLATASLADSLTLTGTVTAGKTVEVYAPIGGTIAKIAAEVGQEVATDDVLYTLKTTKVYAEENGVVTGIFGEPGDSAATITSRYGAVMYLEGDSVYSVSASTETAYNTTDTKFVHVGETVYLKCRSNADRTGVGTITSIEGTSYQISVSSGTFIPGDSVDIYRDSGYTNTKRIGRGTVSRVSPTAVNASGSIVRFAVKDGDKVKRGDLLLETLDGTFDGYYMSGTDILADSPGIIGSLSASQGSSIQSGNVVAVIYPMDGMRIEATVPEDSRGAIHVNDKVIIELEADESKTYNGTVAMVSSVAETGGNETRYRVLINFTPDEAVHFGMSVVVTTLDEEDEEEPEDDETENEDEDEDEAEHEEKEGRGGHAGH